MIGVTIKTDALEAALKKYVAGLHETAQVGLRAATAAAKDSALLAIRSQTKRRTGELERSFGEAWIGPYLRRLSNDSGHARFIDEGTRPHRITARNAKFLRFDVGGVTMFRRSVNHPGTRPMPFLALAMASGQMALKETLASGAERLAANF